VNAGAQLNHYEEYFRSDIVKDREWPRVVSGKLVHLGGFDEAILDAG
jgi:hypothetical protein